MRQTEATRIRRRATIGCSILTLSLALGLSAPAAAQEGWPTIGRDAGGQRFSPLAQITPSNVDQLRVAWTYHLRPANDAGGGLLPSQTIPLVIGDTMFVASPYSR